MNDTTSEMLVDSLCRLLARAMGPEAACDELQPGLWHADLWRQMGDLGMTSLAADYGAEGFGLAAESLIEIGRAGAVVPLLEHDVVAGWVLSVTGLDKPASGVLTCALCDGPGSLAIRRTGASWRLDGHLPRVPFARHADEVVLVASALGRGWALRVPLGSARLVTQQNLAGEPRDQLHFDAVLVEGARAAPLPPAVSIETIKARGALARAFQMIGAMECALAMTHHYARERVQFGRPLSQFQMIQNYLAEVVGEICATRAMCDVAAEVAGRCTSIEEIAAAKIRAGQAARIVADRSHQIHGAMGFTQEHKLHRATLRLWSWREEFGNERHWAQRLSRALAEVGADGLWARVAG